MSDALHFPYMFWAQRESFRSPYCLSQSGMPSPDPAFLEGLSWDLAPQQADALPALRARLAELFGTDPARVVVTAGTSTAMAVCATRWFTPGARVAHELPCYDPLRTLAPRFGAEAVAVERRADEGWKLSPTRVRAALDGARTGHLFLSNPHNPSGLAQSAEDIVALAAEAERAGGVLISDEVYQEFLPPDERVHAFALAPNAVSIGSLTKGYGLGALRIGWILLGDALAERVDSVLDSLFLLTVDPATPCLRAGRRALDELPRLLQPLRRIEHESRPLWERWLTDCDAVESYVPRHGLIAFPRVKGVDDTRALVAHLQAKHGVDVVPGEFFGAPGHLRVGCGLPAESLREGLARLERGIADYCSGGGR
ncbi:MAG: pyridoxal phosphate-dependent aminotransferase [Planctomycetes bacterium]|nr:pyridoxal phosphate-dependent aminotransferase [Planctomycetota bacterium]